MTAASGRHIKTSVSERRFDDTQLGKTSSGKPVLGIEAEPYNTKVRYSGSTQTFVESEGHRQTRHLFPGWSQQDHEEAARVHLAARNSLFIMHGAEYAAAVKEHGESGTLTAGMSRDNFPDSLNTRLIAISSMACRHEDAADAHWFSAGRRASTFPDRARLDQFYSVSPEKAAEITPMLPSSVDLAQYVERAQAAKKGVGGKPQTSMSLPADPGLMHSHGAGRAIDPLSP